MSCGSNATPPVFPDCEVLGPDPAIPSSCLGKCPVRAYIHQITDYTYLAGDITLNTVGALTTQNGVDLVVGDRVLWHEGAAPHVSNGIYLVVDLGDVDSPAMFTRAPDFLSSDQIQAGLLVVVTEGNATYADTLWELSTNNDIILDTTPIDWKLLNSEAADRASVKCLCTALWTYGSADGVLTTTYLPSPDGAVLETGDDFLFIRVYSLADVPPLDTIVGYKSGHIDNGVWTVTDAGETVYSSSTTSNTIGTGSKTFTVDASKNFIASKPVLIRAYAGGYGFMEGTVTSYSGTTLVVNITSSSGAGSRTAWNIYSANTTPVITRRSDFDEDGDFEPGTTIKVQEGAKHANTAWKVVRSDDEPNEWDTALPHINVKKIWFSKCEQQIYSNEFEDNYVQRWSGPHITDKGSLIDDGLVAGMEAAWYVSPGSVAADYDSITVLTKIYNTVTPASAGLLLKALGLPYTPLVDGANDRVNQVLVLWDIGVHAITVKHDAATTVESGIYTHTGADFEWLAGSALLAIYDVAILRWRVMPFGGNTDNLQLGTGGGTATPSPGDITYPAGAGTNIPGGTGNIYFPQGTGNATPGNIQGYAPQEGASGTTPQTMDLLFDWSWPGMFWYAPMYFEGDVFFDGKPFKSCLLNALKCPVLVTVSGLPAASTRTGDVITADANGALGTLDGVTMAVGDRVLLRTDDASAGIYNITDLGSAGTKFVLTRADDMNTSDMVDEGLMVEVRRGDEHKESLWCLMTDIADGAFVINTTATSYCKLAQCGYFSGTVAITGGTITGVTSVGLIPPYLPGGYHQISGTPRYYYLGTNYVANLPTTTIPLADDTLIAIPFIAQRSGTIAELKFKVASSGTGNLRCAFYLNSTTANNQYPGALVGVDLGAKTLSGTGVVTYSGLSINIVEGNLYWLRINADVSAGTPTLSAFTASQAWAILGTTGVFEQDFNLILATETYVTAPDPFTASKAKASGPFPAFCVSYSS